MGPWELEDAQDRSWKTTGEATRQWTNLYLTSSALGV